MPTVDMSSMSPANIFSGVLFSCIGMGVFSYGKKQGSFTHMLIGFSLMLYPYFVPNTIASYAVGTLLTASLFFIRK